MAEMSSKEKDDLANVEVQHSEVKGVEVLGNQDRMNEAFDGENQEHEEGVWAAAKNHPWACFWAFIMCFTIVSIDPVVHGNLPNMSPGYGILRHVLER